MKVINKLNRHIDAYVKVDKNDRRGAGEQDRSGNHKTRVCKEKGKLEVVFPEGKPKEDLVIYLQVDQIPSRKNINGIKVYPGSTSSLEDDVPHHFIWMQKDGKYEAIIHYDLSNKNAKEIEDIIKHEDPETRHPEPGDDQ